MSSSSYIPDFRHGRVGLGLCCINTELQKQKIICSKTMIQKNFTVDKAKEYALSNIKNIKKHLEWNDANGIKNFRISSDIFPHFTNPNVEKYSMDFAKDALEEVKKYAHENGHRLYTHPSQFNVVGTKSRTVFENTVNDLDMHAQMLEYLGFDEPGSICIHGGGIYNDLEGTTRRWIEQFSNLPSRVKRCLAIENCERSFSTRDVLTIAQACKIPVIFDCHHYDCYSLIHPDKPQQKIDDLMDEIIETWGDKNPIFHVSEQRENSRLGSHSDYIESIPQYFLDIPKNYHKSLTLDVEAKLKNVAIMKLYEKYPYLRM